MIVEPTTSVSKASVKLFPEDVSDVTVAPDVVRLPLTTVSGDTLTFALEGGAAVITDENGGKGTVTIADVAQSNGVIHVVDRVLLPN